MKTELKLHTFKFGRLLIQWVVSMNMFIADKNKTTVRSLPSRYSKMLSRGFKFTHGYVGVSWLPTNLELAQN